MIEVKKFSASWCGPCKTLVPTFNEVKNSYTGVTFTEYDIDESSDIAAQYGIRSVPTVIIEKNGAIVQRIMGAQNKFTYDKAINEVLN
jgi:thioredoxin 1